VFSGKEAVPTSIEATDWLHRPLNGLDQSPRPRDCAAACMSVLSVWGCGNRCSCIRSNC